MPERWKGIGLTDTLGGQQHMLTVTEPGLYELIFRSDKPAAQRFRSQSPDQHLYLPDFGSIDRLLP
jgi:hypothetical protein